MSKNTEKPRRKLPKILHFIPHMISFPLTIFSIYYFLKTKCLINLFNLSISHEVNFEIKISLLVRITAWISAVLIFNVLSVIGARIFYQAANPLKDQNKEIITMFNKILTNSVEQTLIFIPLLANWIINESQSSDDLKKGISLAIIWIIGRILFSIGYFFGYLTNFTLLRIFGFVPNLFTSALLLLRLLGIHILI